MKIWGKDRKRSAGMSAPAIALMAIVAVAALWPGPAAAWWNDQWTLRKKITIDTGPSGAGITDPIGTTPVLVRLHVGNFRFGAAKEDGGDLRFVAADDKTPLKHHVEKFDSLLGEALVWVSVPDVKPGAKTEIWLYFGNQKAPAAVDAKGTYDTDALVVYHFAERGTPALDSSAWANNAQNAVTGADGAIIGQGARFDGQTALMLPGSPPLVVPEGGAMTWSAWVNMQVAQPRAVLYARHEGANGLAIVLENGVPHVEVTNGGATQRSGDGAALAPGTWRHLAVTANAGQIAVYVDGNPYATLAAALPTMAGISSVGGDATGGGAGGGGTADSSAAPSGDTPAAASTSPAASTSAGFTGDIDELQIAKSARPAGFIKFAAIGQGADQGKLIAFSVDEENASWFSGYFAVILKSVTLDGWVVIGLLAIMAVISWIVMVDKVGYLNRLDKGNKQFLAHFRELAVDLDALLLEDDENFASLGGRVTAEKDRKVIQKSPLYHLFHRGVREIRHRFAGDQAQTLSPQSIAAIRAVLESGFITETQRMNRLMVILTIAISGGPFLGLLGTVVGVMITFAAIAASGDVNVNAIAPGIAAALVATVAGLGVAIPALFGYNYLLTRIKDITAQLQVFVDELVTRMAESYHPRPTQPHKIAAE